MDPTYATTLTLSADGCREIEMDALDEELLWRMVELARTDHDAYLKALAEMLQNELKRYIWTYEAQAATFSYDPDDPMLYVGDHPLAQWVVGQGRELYRKVADNPRTMPEDASDEDPAFGYLSEAFKAYHKRFGQAVPPEGKD